MSTNKQANRLIHVKSPYLLQHAYNPVDWYPWCEEAFEKAKSEDKPIFLSIGYSTCHWCHVMERESYEDQEVADYLNKYFVSVKVDREERPDVDHIYMEVCQALTGHGGWPLTIIMTPEQKPFFAGTYYPKTDRMGIQGLMSILKAVTNAWQNNRAALTDSGNRILNFINKEQQSSENDITRDIFDIANSSYRNYFDSAYGGFGNAPKFPTPHNLIFLLRYWKITNEQRALDMVEKTLDSMYKGGIYDHIGFGFCRYSTDRKWLVPHFEKMLYDNALLAITYLEAFQATKNSKYGSVAGDILSYILRDMTSPDGGFYCAEDADSEGVEGKFYLWTPDEVRKILCDKKGEDFCLFYNITREGNFEGKSIPNLINNDCTLEDIKNYDSSREKLFKEREKRIHPFKDDKILTSWNGLMITAMAMAGRILHDERYTLAATRAADFILNNLIREDGRLLSGYRDGKADILAFSEDYAFFVMGLIELYETTYESNYLKKALTLTDDLLKLFWDNKNGGLFIYGTDSEQLITRPKTIYDGAIPSGNSVAALNMMKLSRLTGRYELEEKANDIFRAFSGSISAQPFSHAYSLVALMYGKEKGQEVVIVSDSFEKAAPFIEIINEEFRPFTVSILYNPKDTVLNEISPFLRSYGKINGKPTAYVCENHSCKAPVNDINEFRSLLYN